jgi:hypothetical protein
MLRLTGSAFCSRLDDCTRAKIQFLTLPPPPRSRGLANLPRYLGSYSDGAILCMYIAFARSTHRYFLQNLMKSLYEYSHLVLFSQSPCCRVVSTLGVRDQEGNLHSLGDDSLEYFKSDHSGAPLDNSYRLSLPLIPNIAYSAHLICHFLYIAANTEGIEVRPVEPLSLVLRGGRVSPWPLFTG